MCFLYQKTRIQKYCPINRIRCYYLMNPIQSSVPF